MKPGCLSELELRTVLTGTATEEARVSAERHLDTCALCRAELESLAGSAEAFRSLHLRGADEQAPTTPALERVIREFAAAPLGTPTESTDRIDWVGIRQYVTSSRHESSLGRLGDYEILEVVAAGGMGIVLKALDTNLNRIVALKVLAPVLAADAQGRQRFLREARAVAAIRHDHVVGIFAVGEANELPFIAMEFVEGESLAHRLQRDGRLPADEVIRIGREIAAGLAAAHGRGIIHRDIKPANVLIERGSGRVKITDFGLARALDDTGLTRSGFIAGTPEYLSPEQAAGQAVDGRSDLFSLGCLLYAACVGESPFRATTTLAVLRRVADHMPSPVHELNPDVPRWLSRVIEGLLSKEPSMRFASAQELTECLDDGASNRLQKVPPSASRRSRVRRRVAAALIAGGVVALLLFVIGFLTLRMRPFVVYGLDGHALGAYGDLKQALNAEPAGATLELRWNGKREMNPVVLPSRPLVMKAAKNSRPVWIHRSATQSALTASSALTLDGIEFHYVPPPPNALGQPSVTPAQANEPPGVPGQVQPSGVSIVYSLGGPLIITNCLLRRSGQPLSRDDGIAGITLDNVNDCRLADTGLFLGVGKGIVCRRGQPSIVISNCLMFASESIWMHPAPATKPAALRLERNSWKGGSVILFPREAAHRLNVDARSNLFNTAFIIVDQRPQADDQLTTWLTWQDQGNLFALDRRLGAPAGFIRLQNPELGPPRLPDWNDFWGQLGGGSLEARTARFASARQPGSASAFEPVDFGDFDLIDLELFPDSGPRPPRQEWSRFGADTNSVGPALASSARKR